MGALFPAITILVLDVVGRSSVSSILCYQCGLTQEKVLPVSNPPPKPWPTGDKAAASGLIECGESLDRFLINCTAATACHTITWESNEFTPVRFCFPRKASCDGLLLKLQGDVVCSDCTEDRCNA